MVVELGVLIGAQIGDLGAVERREHHRAAHAAGAEVVGPQLRRRKSDVVEEAGVEALQPHDADRQLVLEDRDVEHQLAGVVRLAVRIDRAADQALAGRLEPRRIGGLDHVVDQAAQRGGAEQGSLGTAQHLDAVEVEGVDVGNGDREARFDDVDLVQVVADRRLALLVVGGRRDGADHHFRHARLVVVEHHAR